MLESSTPRVTETEEHLYIIRGARTGSDRYQHPVASSTTYTPSQTTMLTHQKQYANQTGYMADNLNSHAVMKKPAAKGLDSLLKGNSSRFANNRSFNQHLTSSVLQTESTAQMMDVSVVHGANARLTNSYAENQEDDDIVIDSGGRQINHVSNWHASSKSKH